MPDYEIMQSPDDSFEDSLRDLSAKIAALQISIKLAYRQITDIEDRWREMQEHDDD